MVNNFLEIKNLSKIYNPYSEDKIVALNNLNLLVDEGDFVTILGSNAAGKSTLLNLINGSVSPTSGEICLEGNPIIHLLEHKRAKIISSVKQNPDLNMFLSMSVAENLSMAKLKGQRIGLKKGVKNKWRQEFIDMLKPLKMNLEKRLDNKMGNLSGGQKQIIALLMAVITQPKLLLLDEHTASLDPKVSKFVLKTTQKIVEERGVTTLMITHNISQAIEYGNRLIVLENGKAIFEASGRTKKNLSVSQVEHLYRNSYT